MAAAGIYIPIKPNSNRQEDQKFRVVEEHLCQCMLRILQYLNLLIGTADGSHGVHVSIRNTKVGNPAYCLTMRE